MSSCDPTYAQSATDAARMVIDSGTGEQCDLLQTVMDDEDHETVQVNLKASTFCFEEDRPTFVCKTDVTEFLSGDEANVSLIHVYIM